MDGASMHASSAQGALGWVICQLCFAALAFGIVTPDTAKGTTFNKYGCPYAGTVVYTASADIKNGSFHGFIIPGGCLL